MECKFLTNGFAIGYDGVVKPCCHFVHNKKHKDSNTVDLENYHQRSDIVEMREQLANGIWPSGCVKCELIEKENKTSIRHDGLSAYSDLKEDEFVLEIRPGNVCNLACQTCWPSASTRVANFQYKAGIIKELPVTHAIDNFDFLNSIKDRLKKIIVLGGEPFYDKNCLKFLEYCKNNLSAQITMFTNGTHVKEELLSNNNSYDIVFSVDAIGKIAEYVRFGTDWKTVESNMEKLNSMPNVSVRVNLTVSAYNFYYLDDVLEYFLNKWPAVLSIGYAKEHHFREDVVPLDLRKEIILKLKNISIKILKTSLPKGQKENVLKNLKSIITNLESKPYNEQSHNYLKLFSHKLHKVKNINLDNLDYYTKKMLM